MAEEKEGGLEETIGALAGKLGEKEIKSLDEALKWKHPKKQKEVIYGEFKSDEGTITGGTEKLTLDAYKGVLDDVLNNELHKKEGEEDRLLIIEKFILAMLRSSKIRGAKEVAEIYEKMKGKLTKDEKESHLYRIAGKYLGWDLQNDQELARYIQTIKEGKENEVIEGLSGLRDVTKTSIYNLFAGKYLRKAIEDAGEDHAKAYMIKKLKELGVKVSDKGKLGKLFLEASAYGLANTIGAQYGAQHSAEQGLPKGFELADKQYADDYHSDKAA